MQIEVPDRIARDQTEIIIGALKAGHRERAIAAIDYAFLRAAEESGEVGDSTPVRSIFKTRTANALERSLIFTVFDLKKAAPRGVELIKLDRIDWKTLTEIKTVLHSHGINFGD